MSLPPPGIGRASCVRHQCPIVFIDVHTPSIEESPRVIGDDVAGGALAARHLLDLGHRDIAFIGDAAEDPFGFTSSRDRLSGVHQGAGRRWGVPGRSRVGLAAHGRYEARELALRMLTADDPPTAIFAASDTQAFGVMAAAREAGLQVPMTCRSSATTTSRRPTTSACPRSVSSSSSRDGAAPSSSWRRSSARPSRLPSIQLSPELVVRATTAPAKEGRELSEPMARLDPTPRRGGVLIIAGSNGPGEPNAMKESKVDEWIAATPPSHSLPSSRVACQRHRGPRRVGAQSEPTKVSLWTASAGAPDVVAPIKKWIEDFNAVADDVQGRADRVPGRELRLHRHDRRGCAVRQPALHPRRGRSQHPELGARRLSPAARAAGVDH